MNASHVIKILRDKEPCFLLDELTKTYFEEKRFPSIGKFFGASRTKKGRQAIANRLLFMRSITYPWNSKTLTNDATRIEMKKCFFVFLSQELPNPNQP
jgi:hypothetical protein